MNPNQKIKNRFKSVHLSDILYKILYELKDEITSEIYAKIYINVGRCVVRNIIPTNNAIKNNRSIYE